MQEATIKRTIHYNMAIVGGFMAGYAILNRGDMANAQTLNLIRLTMSVLSLNWRSALIYLGAAILYFSATCLTVLIIRKTHKDVQLVCVGIEFVSVILMSTFPAEMNPFLAMYPIFFCMAFQWNSFKGADGNVCSSIFSTNNLKQTAISLTDYFCDHETKHLVRARFYCLVILSFHLGVAMAWVSLP
ncbi:MAG: YoaK family protein, partial [Oscillospiraceae bacterium]|nr:YoaK family protein [Oscillospiraceae bacterium]